MTQVLQAVLSFHFDRSVESRGPVALFYFIFFFFRLLLEFLKALKTMVITSKPINTALILISKLFNIFGFTNWNMLINSIELNMCIDQNGNHRCARLNCCYQLSFVCVCVCLVNLKLNFLCHLLCFPFVHFRFISLIYSLDGSFRLGLCCFFFFWAAISIGLYGSHNKLKVLLFNYTIKNWSLATYSAWNRINLRIFNIHQTQNKTQHRQISKLIIKKRRSETKQEKEMETATAKQKMKKNKRP